MSAVAPAAPPAETEPGRWSSHRLQSLLVRIVVYAAPVGASITTGVTEKLTVVVYDCPGGDTDSSTSNCTQIGANTTLVPKWNLAATYESHDFVMSLDHLVPLGRQLRIELDVTGSGLWVPLVAPFESSLDYSG